MCLCMAKLPGIFQGSFLSVHPFIHHDMAVLRNINNIHGPMSLYTLCSVESLVFKKQSYSVFFVSVVGLNLSNFFIIVSVL